MTAEAIALGGKLIANETDLDGQFAARTVSENSLSSTMAMIGQAQAELRKTHLKYHLLTTAFAHAAPNPAIFPTTRLYGRSPQTNSSELRCPKGSCGQNMSCLR